MIDLFALGISENSAPSVSRRRANIGWENRTSGRSYRPPVQVKRVQLPKTSISCFDRYSYRCKGSVETRKVLGKSLYIIRGDLIRYLVTVYGADKSVCLLASVNMLLKWKSCYKKVCARRMGLQIC